MTETSAPAVPTGAPGGGGRDNVPVIRERLRADILGGRLLPGAQISQAGVAAEFGVSRGPVREAFRLLERDGLIEARVNHRARVTGLSVHELEHLYTLRVVSESLAVSVSVPAFTGDELDELDRLGEVLRTTDTATFDFDTWDEVHQRFHMLLLAHSGAQMLGTAAEWAAHTQRYRRVFAEEGRGLPPGAGEHAVLAQLCRDGDGAAAARLLALHLSRAALTLIAQMAPTYDPVLLRAGIRQVLGAESRP
ncbi:GntR family transcriptional regulator [Nocardioides aquiterrae]|uniref:GntR family transcriptional regulator n=1 Tax=Nocardioides aquiterrae TaxID=203799 RepID=UPI0031CE4433